jgi:hypothetical protein
MENLSRNTIHPHPRISHLIHNVMIKKNKYQYLTVVASSNGHFELTMNWIKGFNNCFEETNHFLVVAMDNIIYQRLLSKNVPTILAEDLISEHYFLPAFSTKSQLLWREDTFTLLSRLKLHILLPLLKYYLKDSEHCILFSDVDIVFTNSSLFSYLDNEIPAEKHIAVTSDNINQLDYLCSCFYMMRNTQKVRTLFEAFRNISIEYKKNNKVGKDDQELLNHFMIGPFSDILFRLPMGHFPNGQALYENYPATVNMTPWLIHANYVIGLYTKIEFLKKYKVWFLEDEWWYSWMAEWESKKVLLYRILTYLGITMIRG